jgi:hypothetical protein
MPTGFGRQIKPGRARLPNDRYAQPAPRNELDALRRIRPRNSPSRCQGCGSPYKRADAIETRLGRPVSPARHREPVPLFTFHLSRLRPPALLAPGFWLLTPFFCNFSPQRRVLPMKPIFKGVNMKTKIIDFSPGTSATSRITLRGAVLDHADRTDWFLALWLGVWAIYATVECIGQLGFLRVY